MNITKENKLISVRTVVDGDLKTELHSLDKINAFIQDFSELSGSLDNSYIKELSTTEPRYFINSIIDNNRVNNAEEQYRHTFQQLIKVLSETNFWKNAQTISHVLVEVYITGHEDACFLVLYDIVGSLAFNYFLDIDIEIKTGIKSDSELKQGCSKIALLAMGNS